MNRQKVMQERRLVFLQAISAIHPFVDTTKLVYDTQPNLILNPAGENR